MLARLEHFCVIKGSESETDVDLSLQQNSISEIEKATGYAL